MRDNQGIGSSEISFLNGGSLSVDQVAQGALGRAKFRMGNDPEMLQRLADSVACVAAAVKSGASVYGVTTGFGGMAGEKIEPDSVNFLQNNLLSFLATAAGPTIDPRHTRAAMLLRANVLLRGYSGVRAEIIERLLMFLEHDAVPIVREFGSIGASGDLVPLSAIARAITGLAGKVKVSLNGRTCNSETALSELRLQPIELLPKEGLALVNGTSFSAAIAANAVYETKNLMALAIAAQALMLRALSANEAPLASFVHQCKPHPGQVWSAMMMQRLLSDGFVKPAGRELTNGKSTRSQQVQDRYSIRCFPQYMGSIVESVARVHRTVEIEMNSVSDNPLIDSETGEFHQSGNFLGQYLGVAMDDLRRCNGLMAKHLDVQIASLVAPEFSDGLPPSLRGNAGRSFNMGLKGLQITGNSIMPLLTYLGNPLVEHYPTHAEQFNQNINGLSWGAANLAWKSVQYFQHYIAVGLIFAVQALDLRAKTSLGHFDGRRLLGSLTLPIYGAIYELLDCQAGSDRPLLFDDSDRWLEQDLEALRNNIADEGSLVAAVQPILDSFAEQFLSEDVYAKQQEQTLSL